MISNETKMNDSLIDVSVTSIIALVAGWLIKSFTSASKRELEELRKDSHHEAAQIRDEIKHLVTTRSFDKELGGINNRLDRIEEKIDKLMSQ